VHRDELLRLVLKHMRRPQGPVDARTLVLELRSQPAVDDVYAAQNSASDVILFCHEAMVTPGKKNLNCLA
jgi:hypothetical protein